MSKSIVEFVEKFEFEGDPWRVITINGRPCWIAKEVGKSLEYGKDGTGLVDLINKEWLSSFEEGKHYEFLKGKKLRDFKQLLKGCGHYPISEFASKLMVLYKAGINKVLLKSNKPKADRIQDWFVDEVLAQIELDGRYSPDRTVEDGEIVGSFSEGNDHAIKVAMEREARLAEQLEYRQKRDFLKFKIQRMKFEAQRMKLEVQQKEFEAQQKKYEAKRVEEILKEASKYAHVSEESIFAHRVANFENETGRDFTALKPPAEKIWKTPTEIAKTLGISPAMVGRIITKLGLRNPEKYPKHCKGYWTISKESGKQVICYVYSKKAVQLIKKYYDKNIRGKR
jgi:prophage antirepressor-like protein